MAELKDARKPGRLAPRPSSWLLDLDNEDMSEPVIDPYGGRLFGDQVVFDLDDSDSDRIGDSGGLFDF